MDKVKILQVKSSNSAWAIQELERRINECIQETRGVVRDIKINIVTDDRQFDSLYIATIIFSDPFDIIRLEGKF